MLRMLILADDLSGAADCGVACAGAGLDTLVALGDIAGDVHAQVLSVDADTRSMTARAAAAEVRRLVRKYALDGNVLFFKKIDSTLRGNVGVELAAALGAYRGLHSGTGRTVAVMAPAFPALGRTTVNGLQQVYGQPLHETKIWRSHGMSGPSYIPEMLVSAGLKTALLPLGVLRSAHRTLVGAMRLAADMADVLICDAETDFDLQAIAVASMQLGSKTIWVGSAGLAYHLPHAAGLSPGIRVAQHQLLPVTGPLLFVVGSTACTSTAQVQLLTSCSQTLRISVPPDVLLAGPGSPSWPKYEQELVRAIEMKRDVVLGAGSHPRIEMLERPLLSAALARMTSPLSGRIGALIASGGETARTVLQSWGVTGLRLIGELEKGVPISITENWSRRLPVITKAGDFGEPETLLHCRQFLQGTERSLGKLRDTRRGYL